MPITLEKQKVIFTYRGHEEGGCSDLGAIDLCGHVLVKQAELQQLERTYNRLEETLNNLVKAVKAGENVDRAMDLAGLALGSATDLANEIEAGKRG